MTTRLMTRLRWAAVGMALAAVAAGWSPVRSYADQLSKLKQKQEYLKQKQVQTKQRIQDLGRQEDQLKNQISQIQQQIEDLQSQIFATQADIQRRSQQIAQLQQEIRETQQKLQAQYGVLAQRVRVMYEAGHTTYLQVLFSASSFADLLSRMQLLSMIAEQDQKVLEDIRATKRQLDASNARLVAEQAKQRQVYAELLDKQRQQEAAEQHERTLLGQVRDERLQEEAQLRSESEAMQNLQALIQQLQASMGTYTGPAGGWTWPVPGYHQISSGYGWRTWSDGSKEFHNGIDIPAPVGTPIVAATSGKVLYAGPASGFGDWIVVESAGGLLEIYGHMYSWEIKVTPGEVVKTGQVIAGVGSNGFSTGPHLHFTIATGFDSSGRPISVSPTQYVGG
ncbi:MAG: peptidoglycan DD-metalloendopeptidase family protein [Alicyclobacillaceae bacterium]|nr:peptidoglycan DD-metalloendopeptidase family protein [Alicyclobacillaceae bacterium]